MMRKLPFVTIFAFWVCMNYLLWQAEYGGVKEVGSSIPVDLVWGKILKAPDNSSLEVAHRNKKLGYIRWMPNIGEEMVVGKTGSEEALPEGMIQSMTGYTVDIEGNVMLASITNHVRGNMHVEFGKDFQWKSFHVQAQLKLGTIEIQSTAVDRTASFKFSSPGFTVERTFSYSELQNPASLLEAFDLPSTLLPFARQSQGTPGSHSGLVWQAFNDTIRYGHNAVRVYRLKTKLWERYEVGVIVSRVGEILRIELPNNLTLKNDILFAN